MTVSPAARPSPSTWLQRAAAGAAGGGEAAREVEFWIGERDAVSARKLGQLQPFLAVFCSFPRE